MPAKKSVANEPYELLEFRKTTNQLKEEDFGNEVIVAGYVYNLRFLSKKLAFLNLYDQHGDIQVTYKEGLCENMQELEKVTRQTFIVVTGKLVKGKAKGGKEIEARKFFLLTDKPAMAIPIEIEDQNTGLEKRLDYRWLDLRNPQHRLPIVLLSKFVLHAKEYFAKNDYTEIFTPKIVGYPTEGGAEVFMLPYFNKEAYLAQSPQFYKQMAICSGIERVFEIAPAFRADPSFTTRHTTEFTSFDMEIAYVSSHHDVMAEEERTLQQTFSNMKKDVEEFSEEYKNVVIEDIGEIPKIKMEDAYELVNKTNVDSNGDLSPEGEREVAKYIKETQDSDFVFVTDYPFKTRPFYHMLGEPMSNGQETTKSFDLLYRGVEITTGAQREHNYEKLEANIIKKKLNKDTLNYYIDLFRYGAPPHGGIGLGPARVIKQILNLGNVREATFVPRDPKRLSP